MPKIDVTLCKDCKHYGATLMGGIFLPVCKKLEFTKRKEDDYCSWAERKEDGKESV